MGRAVYIVGPGYQYEEMFWIQGWNVTRRLLAADLVQFTGGADVSPELYGQNTHPRTQFDPDRDIADALVYKMALNKKLPMAGICRGGQFLNVMNGGGMFQHVNHHAIPGTHKATDFIFKDEIEVTSTHHQMMRPTRDAEVVLVAHEADVKESLVKGSVLRVYHGTKEDDIEAVYYEETNCFCFQPHPEFEGYDTLRERYFEHIDHFLFRS